jgi:hypothetical protein
MKTVMVDLNGEPELKDLLTDLTVGDRITIHAMIKSKDDQTAGLTIEGCEEGEDPDEDDTESSDDADEKSKKPMDMGKDEEGESRPIKRHRLGGY